MSGTLSYTLQTHKVKKTLKVLQILEDRKEKKGMEKRANNFKIVKTPTAPAVVVVYRF